MKKLICLIFSKRGIATGLKLAALFEAAKHEFGSTISSCSLFAPSGLWQRAGRPAGIIPVDNLQEMLRAHWSHSAFLFIGATGIAVRLIAPLLCHKSIDPPVLVADPTGKFIIALLSGHLGGANELARHLATLCEAEPVITTASDSCTGNFSLDLIMTRNKLNILDWHELPKIQALLLEREIVNLWDPFRCFPHLENLRDIDIIEAPAIAISWQKIPKKSGVLRVSCPCLHIGIGFRKDVSLIDIGKAVEEVLDSLNAAQGAIASVATIEEKADSLKNLSKRLGVSFQSFNKWELAKIHSPCPSRKCAERFGVPAFSVCEASALLAASISGNMSTLLVPKVIFQHKITIAVAMEHFGGA